jgi:hypothetical protein
VETGHRIECIPKSIREHTHPVGWAAGRLLGLTVEMAEALFADDERPPAGRGTEPAGKA